MKAGIHMGRCHCGASTVRLETSRPAAELPVRACDCGFCRRHGAATTTDPAGRLEIRIDDEASVLRYRFGLNTADFLVCRGCGVYVAAVIEDGAHAYATLNVHVLDDREAFSASADPVSYGEEDADTRRRRRLARWTPATVTVG